MSGGDKGSGEARSFELALIIARKQQRRIDVDSSLHHLGDLDLGPEKITTLSRASPDSRGVIGLLYVPSLRQDSPCYNQSRQYVPNNVVHRENIGNLSNTPYTLFVAIAPWFSAECALDYLNQARFKNDDLRGLLFYVPDNGTAQPPGINSEQWDMDDGGRWKKDHNFPVFAVPGATGAAVVQKLADYSNMTTAPGGKDILERYNKDSPSSFKILATVSTNNGSANPSLWLFLLIVVAALGGSLIFTSIFMHWRAKRRRERLRRMIVNGDIALGVLGVKKVTVPKDDIDNMPLYIYVTDSQPTDTETSDEQSNSPTEVTGAAEPDEPSAIPAKQTATVTTTAIDGPESTPDATEDNQQVVSNPSNNPILPKTYDSEAQPSCPICLDDYVSKKTIVRSLPCQHIYHPECIDKFLSRNSSMCPMCKASALRAGYCPPVITSTMVRRERDIRLRAQLEALERAPAGLFRNVKLWWLRKRAARNGHRLGENSLELALRRAVVRESVQRRNERRRSLAQMTRSQRAEVRGRELAAADGDVGGEGVEERPRPGWRRALGRLFPSSG